MQMLKKLFNSDNKFYLELDELKDSKVVQNAVKTAQKAADVAKETASEVADVAQDKLQSAISTEEKPDQSQAKAKPDQSQANGTGKSKVADKNGATPDSKANDANAAPKLENTGASSYDPPFWVAAMYNNNGQGTNSDSKVAEQTFATDNLMPMATKYRRRPGGSLDKFKDMAKQAKTPKG